MSTYDLTRMIIGIVAVLGALTFFFIKLFYKKNPITARFITRTAIFAAISIVLYVVPYLKFPVPFFPAFLEFHFDEIPAFIAGFAYGPLSATFIILIKTIVKIPIGFSTSMGVGELTDLIYGFIFVLPACFIYRKHKNFKGALVGLGIGTISQVIFSCFFTSFVILKFYMYVMGLPEQSILQMCQAANPAVTSLGWPFFFIIALPFNLMKDAIVIVITILLYKRLHRLIDRLAQQKN